MKQLRLKWTEKDEAVECLKEYGEWTYLVGDEELNIIFDGLAYEGKWTLFPIKIENTDISRNNGFVISNDQELEQVLADEVEYLLRSYLND